MSKLNSGQKHFLNLIVEGAKETGWAKVSRATRPLVADMPPELVELQRLEDGTGLARLTAEGQSVVDAQKWI